MTRLHIWAHAWCMDGQRGLGAYVLRNLRDALDLVRTEPHRGIYVRLILYRQLFVCNVHF